MASGQSTFSGELYNLSFDSIEEDSDNAAWFSLIQNLSFAKLETLKSIFKDKSVKHKEMGLNKDEFLDAICYLYGNSKYSLQSILLFDDIAKGDKITITWNNFLDFLIENISPKEDKKVRLALTKIERIPHAKRESVVKIVLIETEKYFCYAIITKHGRIGLYDGNLNFLTSYHVIMTREDISRSEDERRRRNRWVTDAIFCEDVLMFIVTNTARSVMIYEASGLKHVPYWLILSTPNIVECMTYKCYRKLNEGSSESILFMGDCNGEVTCFKFPQPKNGLLRRKYNDRISLFYWNELPNEKDYILIKSYGKLHRYSIRHIIYFDLTDTIFTCCGDSDASVVQRHISSSTKAYVFKMKRGASCFALSRSLKLLITGSDDGTIRLWNSVVVSKPIATLLGHQCEIVDLQVMDKQHLLLTYSRDGVVKIWDLKEHKCLQTLKINFPCFGLQGKTIEWGISSIFPGPKRQLSGDALLEYSKKNKTYCFSIEDLTERKEAATEYSEGSTLDSFERSNILVTCCNYLANIRLAFNDVNIEKTFEMQVLPPPPLQNSVLIPSSWRIQEELEETFESVDVIKDYNIEEKMKELNFILNKDLLEEDFMKSDINHKIAILETKKLQMQKYVAMGAPYLALDLFDITELKLSENLPIPDKKSIKSLVERTQKILADATLKDQIFSEPSSSRSKSSRSSLNEFSY